jgi:DNA-binding NarL/FixJ family response regulator
MRTILLPDQESDRLDRIRRLVGLSGNGSEYRLVHSPEVSRDLALTCRQLAPALLLTSTCPLQRLSMLQELLSSGDLHILMISDRVDDALCERCLHNSYSGAVERSVSDQMLWKAIESIFEGELWFPRKVLSRHILAVLGKNQPKLTSRESEILKLIGLGLKNQEIADDLLISRETVRWYVRRLHAKLGVAPRVTSYPGVVHHAKRTPLPN